MGGRHNCHTCLCKMWSTGIGIQALLISKGPQYSLCSLWTILHRFRIGYLGKYGHSPVVDSDVLRFTVVVYIWWHKFFKTRFGFRHNVIYTCSWQPCLEIHRCSACLVTHIFNTRFGVQAYHINWDDIFNLDISCLFMANLFHKII